MGRTVVFFSLLTCAGCSLSLFVVALDSELLMSCFKTNKNKTKITGTWSNPALVQTTSLRLCVHSEQRRRVDSAQRRACPSGSDVNRPEGECESEVVLEASRVGFNRLRSGTVPHQ